MNDGPQTPPPPPPPPPPVHRLLGGTGLGLAFLAAGLLLILGRDASAPAGAAPLQAVAAVWVAGLGLTSIALIRADSRRTLWATRILALGVALPAGLAGVLLRAAAKPSPAMPLLFLLSVSAVSWVGASFVLARLDPVRPEEDRGQAP